MRDKPMICELVFVVLYLIYEVMDKELVEN
jgi:hypothetical protein